jgi:phosphate transport system protein
MAVRRARAESDAFGLLALEQPVAGELREIVSLIQIMADAERMCALAVHVAKIARMRHPGHLLPAEVRAGFAEMGKVANAMGDSANRALVSHDPRTARLREEDEVMDNLHRQLLSVLLDPHWEHGVPAAVDLALLGRFYERFADHAVEVGRRVVFMVTGALPPMRTSAPTERRDTWTASRRTVISFAAPPETSAPPGICQPLDPAPGWLDLRPGRVLYGSATPSASPSRLGVPGRPRSSPRSQSPRARPPSPPGQRLSCRCRRKLLGRGTSTHAFLWLAQTRRRARPDGKSLPQQGVSSTFVPIFFDYFVVSCLFNSMSWVSSSTTACATTLVASAARAAGVPGPAVVELSMSLSRRSMRREISACAGMSSRSKSLNALNTGSLNVTVVSS